jgi:DNA-3-methyladenine glycosylase II
MKRLTDGDEHLRSVDHVIRGLIDERGPIDPDTDRRGSRPDAYEALARAIVGQQLSTKAARSIWERLVAPFDGSFPQPAELIATDPESLREAGLSWSKVGFLRDLAERIEDGKLDLGRLARLSD